MFGSKPDAGYMVVVLWLLSLHLGHPRHKSHIFCYIVVYINYKFCFWYLQMSQIEIQFMPATAWLLSRPPMQGRVLKEVPEKMSYDFLTFGTYVFVQDLCICILSLTVLKGLFLTRFGNCVHVGVAVISGYMDFYISVKYEGKSVPLQAWTVPEGSKKFRFPDFVTTAQDGGKVVSLTHRPPLPPGNTPGTHFC